jgi:hypothetical protein
MERFFLNSRQTMLVDKVGGLLLTMLIRLSGMASEITEHLILRIAQSMDSNHGCSLVS